MKIRKICVEFYLIDKYFNRTNLLRKDIIIGIGDDCALLSINKKKCMTISTDTLVSGVHFHPDIDPADLGHKLLAINLSDIASMGADPMYVLLSLTIPSADEMWLSAFSDSLFKQLDRYDVQLIGGDINYGPLSLTMTAHGLVSHDRYLTRSGANVGDWIYVTGTLGDSAAGLAILQNRLKVNNISDRQYLLSRHLRPQPRIEQGKILRNFASSATDISDGTIMNLYHILVSSNCGACINIDKIPISQELLRCADSNQILDWALSGGEDYELCFTVPEIYRDILDAKFKHFDIPITCIGQINSLPKTIKFVKNNNKQVKYRWIGFSHFLNEEHKNK